MATILSRIHKTANKVWMTENDILDCVGRPPVATGNQVVLSLSLDLTGCIKEDITLLTLGRHGKVPAMVHTAAKILEIPKAKQVAAGPKVWYGDSSGKRAAHKIWNTFIKEARTILDKDIWYLTSRLKAQYIDSDHYNTYVTNRHTILGYSPFIVQYASDLNSTPVSIISNASPGWFTLATTAPTGPNYGWGVFVLERVIEDIDAAVPNVSAPPAEAYRLLIPWVNQKLPITQRVLDEALPALRLWRRWKQTLGGVSEYSSLEQLFCFSDGDYRSKGPMAWARKTVADAIRRYRAWSRGHVPSPVKKLKVGGYNFELHSNLPNWVIRELRTSCPGPWFLLVRKRGRLLGVIDVNQTSVTFDCGPYFVLWGRGGSHRQVKGLLPAARKALHAMLPGPFLSEVPKAHRSYLD